MNSLKTTIVRAAKASSKGPLTVPSRALSDVPTQVSFSLRWR